MADQDPIVQPAPPIGWICPRLTLRWPDYFRPNAQDAKDTFTAIATGIKECSIVTRRKAIEMAQRIMKVDNIDSYLESLDEELAEKQAKAEEEAEKQAQRDLQRLMAEAEAGHGEPGPTRPGKPQDGKEAAGNGSGAPPATPPKDSKPVVAGKPVGGPGNAGPTDRKTVSKRTGRGSNRRNPPTRL